MHEYEIRFLRADHSTDTIMMVMHLNDNAAVRAAKRMVEARPFEVWRGMQCIYCPPIRTATQRPTASLPTDVLAKPVPPQDREK